MNSYTPTKKSLYISIMAALVGVLLVAFSIIVVIRSISFLDREHKSAESMALGIEETFLLKRDLSLLREEIDLIDSFFVSPGGEVDFIEKMEQLAQNSKVQIEIGSIAVPKKNESSDLVENLSMQVSFEGEWNSTMAFLKALENMPYAISIGKVEISLLGGPLWKGQVDISVLKIK